MVGNLLPGLQTCHRGSTAVHETEVFKSSALDGDSQHHADVGSQCMTSWLCPVPFPYASPLPPHMLKSSFI